MEKVQINEIGFPRVSAGWAGDRAEEGGVLMGEGKVSEDVLFHPLCRRKPGIIKNRNDIFQGAHHVLQSGADEFFFRTEIVPHGGDIHICFFRDGPHGGCLESFFTEDAGRVFS